MFCASKAAVISDVTPRYASQWCNGVCKLRVDSNWWNETLLVYAPPHHEVELEDKDIKSMCMSIIINPYLTGSGLMVVYPIMHRKGLSLSL